MTHPLRRGLELAREQLKKDGHLELQGYVDAVLAPRGWKKLQESEVSAPTSALSLTMTRGLKKALKAAADEFDVVLDSLAEEGFRAVLETDWLPPRTVSNKSLASEQQDPEESARTVLQLQVDNALRQQAAAVVEELTERAGYRVTLSSIAISWMAEELGVRRPGEGTQPLLLQWIPLTWFEHWERVTAEQGVTFRSVLEDGIRALRDGAWEFPRPVRSAKGAGVQVPGGEVRKYKVRVATELVEYLDEQAPVLAKKHSRKVFPATIGLAILKDRLGLPAGE